MTSQSRGPQGPLDLIVVEDSVVDTELEVDALREAGLTVEARRVEDEPAFRAAIEERLPDAILADWTLPLFSGRRALEIAHERCPDVPLIFVSGTIAESTAIAALRQGAVDYVYKNELQQLGPALLRAVNEAHTLRLLRESEEKYRRLFENSRDALLVLKPPSWHFTDANNAALQMFGVADKADFAVLTPWDVSPEQQSDGRLSSEKAQEMIAIGQREGSNSFEWKYRRLNGETFDADVLLTHIQDGEEVSAQVTVRDITERRKIEEALQKSEAYIKNILETVDEGFIVVDRGYRILSANKAYCNSANLSAEQVIGKLCHEVSHHCDKPCFEAGEECPVKRAFETGAPHAGSHTHVRENGTTYHVEIKSYPVTDASGNVMSVIETITDVTEKKKLEEQLRHAQKMEAIGTLAGGIAHDFNNILNVILGFGTMVMDRIGDDPLSKEQMNEVLLAADRAANLTKRLLLFSRKEVAEFKSMDVKKIILNMEKMLSRIIGEDIKLVAELMGTKAMVMADAGQMEQVLLNLATNARDAMPKGGSLTIKTELREIDQEFIDAYSYGTPGTYAVIYITDTGLGIDKETQDRIFDPFFTTKEVGKGTGLGLSIVYGIIKEHNGFIKVYSEPGEGTTFKIWLPVIEDTATKKPEVEALTSLKGGTETILVAEDDASLRKLTRIVLESAGYTVITAEDGEDAITKFMENKDKIALAVLDMIMPNKSGKEVGEVIREVSPRTKILFASGYTMDIVKTKELTESGFDFILKPVLPRDLLKKVREVLDR